MAGGYLVVLLLPPEQWSEKKSVPDVPFSVLGCADHLPPRGSFAALLAPPPLPVAIPFQFLTLDILSVISPETPVLFPELVFLLGGPIPQLLRTSFPFAYLHISS